MRVSDHEFLRAWNKLQSPQKVADALGLSVRGVYERRRNLEKRYDMDIASERNAKKLPKGRKEYAVENGAVVVFSDAHYWPDQAPTTAHRALVEIVRELKPKAVVANGDVLDFPSISRWGPIMWEQAPSLKQEIEQAQDRLAEIENASKNSKLFWTFGNHDSRLERRLATVAPEYRGIRGVHLKDHFPRWEPCWSVMLNNTTVIKHRYHNGIHAAWQNVLKAHLPGGAIVTGHLHRLMVTPFTGYHGRSWGVDTGTLAEPWGDQFLYLEDSPRQWASGFAILSFENGALLPPELVEVLPDSRIWWRGQTIKV